MANGNREGEKKVAAGKFLSLGKYERREHSVIFQVGWRRRKKWKVISSCNLSLLPTTSLASELATNARKSRLTFFSFSERKSSFSFHSLRPRSTCCEEELRLLGPFPRVSEEDFLELSKYSGDKLASAREADTFDKSFRFALRPPDVFLLPTIAAWRILRR